MFLFKDIKFQLTLFGYFDFIWFHVNYTKSPKQVTLLQKFTRLLSRNYQQLRFSRQSNVSFQLVTLNLGL